MFEAEICDDCGGCGWDYQGDQKIGCPGHCGGTGWVVVGADRPPELGEVMDKVEGHQGPQRFIKWGWRR